ncbi:MAG: hypothetical protein O2968_19570 [Acidobacteria bacterium]|nr:hypothetical protein [Acidobacteriota bacterium]
MPVNRCLRDLAVFFAILLLAGIACSSEKSEVQIREAIRAHLASRTDLSKMDIELDGVDYTDDEATARVTIKAREDANAKMQKVYQLRKVGSEWQVQPSDESAGHGAAGGGGGSTPPSGLPPGHPSAGGTQPRGGPQMPPGHPPIGGQPPPQQQLLQGDAPTVNQ